MEFIISSIIPKTTANVQEITNFSKRRGKRLGWMKRLSADVDDNNAKMFKKLIMASVPI